MRRTIFTLGILLITTVPLAAEDGSSSPERWPGFLGVGATEVGDADVKRREERGHQHGGGSDEDSSEKKADGEQPAAQEQPTRPAGRPERPSSGRDSQEEGSAPRTRDGCTFADPIQYGYAAVNGSLVIRTGGKVYCLRNAATAPAGIKAVKVSAADTSADQGGNK